jgi:FKBP12-rapamycin complex-associated protein
MVVSRELIRVAILWHELWHEGLEEASRLYFTEKNPEGMISTLEPLHEMLEAVRMFFVSMQARGFKAFHLI